jgi:hypothetical protein
MRRRYKRQAIQRKPEGTEQFLKPKIQAKLSMGKPGDKYEVEADKMADQVVSNKSGEASVQKMEGEEEVQAKCAECENEQVQKKGEEEEVQAKTDQSQSKGAGIEGKLRNGSGGQSMDAKTKAEMESGFGADFSNVNIHTDSEAAQMSQDIGAQAFTHGNDIYFNEGKYNPNSKQGKHLLAHELTHTIQQKGMVQKKVQKQTDAVTYTCSGSAARGTFNGRITISGTTDAPDGTVISFHYLSGAGCSPEHRTVAAFGSAVVAGGKYRIVLPSNMTSVPGVGRTFIASIGNTNSYCCITVRPA